MHPLEAYRIENNLTYDGLAVLIGVANATAARRLALGKTRRLAVETVRRVAESTNFQVTADDMFGIDPVARRLVTHAEAA